MPPAAASRDPGYHHDNGVYPDIGIAGTPAIDLFSNTLFVVSTSVENFVVNRLHSLDLASGKEKANYAWSDVRDPNNGTKRGCRS